jgi:hypothetical protein
MLMRLFVCLSVCLCACVLAIGIVLSTTSDEVLIQVRGDYCYRLLIVRRADVLTCLAHWYETITGNKLPLSSSVCSSYNTIYRGLHHNLIPQPIELMIDDGGMLYEGGYR